MASLEESLHARPKLQIRVKRKSVNHRGDSAARCPGRTLCLAAAELGVVCAGANRASRSIPLCFQHSGVPRPSITPVVAGSFSRSSAGPAPTPHVLPQNGTTARAGSATSTFQRGAAACLVAAAVPALRVSARGSARRPPLAKRSASSNDGEGPLASVRRLWSDIRKKQVETAESLQQLGSEAAQTPGRVADSAKKVASDVQQLPGNVQKGVTNLAQVPGEIGRKLVSPLQSAVEAVSSPPRAPDRLPGNQTLENIGKAAEDAGKVATSFVELPSKAAKVATDVVEFPSKASQDISEKAKAIEDTAKGIASIPSTVQANVDSAARGVDAAVTTVVNIPKQVSQAADGLGRTAGQIAAAPGQVAAGVKSTADAIAATPGKVQGFVTGVAETTGNIVAAPGRAAKGIQETGQNIASTVDAVVSFPGKVVDGVTQVGRTIEGGVNVIRGLITAGAEVAGYLVAAATAAQTLLAPPEEETKSVPLQVPSPAKKAPSPEASSPAKKAPSPEASSPAKKAPSSKKASSPAKAAAKVSAGVPETKSK